MLLKNHLIEVFKKASSENNFLLKENVVLKWVHRFGINSLDDLLIHSPVQKENQHEENQEIISLIEEEQEEENQKQNQEQIKMIEMTIILLIMMIKKERIKSLIIIKEITGIVNLRVNQMEIETIETDIKNLILNLMRLSKVKVFLI